jgi:hypothetical protein
VGVRPLPHHTPWVAHSLQKSALHHDARTPPTHVYARALPPTTQAILAPLQPRAACALRQALVCAPPTHPPRLHQPVRGPEAHRRSVCLCVCVCVCVYVYVCVCCGIEAHMISRHSDCQSCRPPGPLSPARPHPPSHVPTAALCMNATHATS